MSTHYNLRPPSIGNIAVGFFANSSRSFTGTDLNSVTTSGSAVTISSPNFQLVNNQLFLNDSEPNHAAITGFDINSYTQASIVFSTNSYGAKTGAYFGISEGQAHSISSGTSGNYSRIAITVVADSIVDMSTTNYAATTTIGNYSRIAITDVADSIVDMSTTNYAVTTTIGNYSRTPATNPLDSIVDMSTTNYSTTASLDDQSHTILISKSTAIECGLDNPNKEIVFSLDNSGEGVYARLKDGDAEIAISAPYTPVNFKDVFCVILEKTPYNKLSVYLNGKLLASSTSAKTISNFPVNTTGMRLFANGRACNTLTASIINFLIYNKKLLDSEIINSAAI